MSEIKSTTDYNMFHFLECNCEIRPKVVEYLKYSIGVNNLLKYRPILVNKDMGIIDGQHRLKAAEALGVPIFYQVDEKAEDENILLLNAHQKRPLSADYLKYHATKGNEAYRNLDLFCKKHKFSVTHMLTLMGMGGAGTRRFNMGQFKGLLPEEYAYYADLITKSRLVLNNLKTVLFNDTKLLSSIKLQCALIKLLSNPDVDFDTLINKLTIKSAAIHACTSNADYIKMLKDIYNWKNQNPIE